VKATVALAGPAAVGLNLTVTEVLAPAPKLKEPPATILKGPVGTEALPVKVPPPVLVTVKFALLVAPTRTLPKSKEAGLTEIAGAGTTSRTVSAPVKVLEVRDRSPISILPLLLTSSHKAASRL
jgi:hypothetical protein